MIEVAKSDYENMGRCIDGSLKKLYNPSRREHLTSLKKEDANHEVGCCRECVGLLYDE
jgi:hypothetical protein